MKLKLKKKTNGINSYLEDLHWIGQWHCQQNKPQSMMIAWLRVIFIYKQKQTKKDEFM